MERQAQAGRAQGQFCLGHYLMSGTGGQRRNPAEGFRYFKLAAEQGHVGAMSLLGDFYAAGMGTARDFREAEQWYLRAANAGSSTATYELADLYLYGAPGVPQNVAAASRWATRAQEQGNAYALALLNEVRVMRPGPAQELLAEGHRLYRAGNRAAAAKPFLTAALAGNANAQYNIGWHYENGVGVQQNRAEARRWYRSAADLGHALAMRAVGLMYEQGDGVPEDWMQAATWYRRSADRGEVNGLYSLAGAYQFGIGVPQNRRLAIEWHERAAAAGNQESARTARQLRESTNFIGFRDDRESQLVLGNRLRSSAQLLGGDPAGITFRNSTDRLNWLSGLRQRLDREECIAARRPNCPSAPR
jgi:TPR repeat protein